MRAITLVRRQQAMIKHNDGSNDTETMGNSATNPLSANWTMRTLHVVVLWPCLISTLLAIQACATIPPHELSSTVKNEGRTSTADTQKMEPTKYLPNISASAAKTGESKPATRPQKKYAPTRSKPRLSAGDCWVQTTVLPRKITTPLEIVTRDAVNQIQVIPATFKPEQRERVIRQGAQSYRVEPPVFKRVTERVLVREEVHRTVVDPAIFETRVEKIQVESARKILVPCPSPGQGSLNAQRGQSLCVKTLPARYKNITRKILLKPATTREEVEPAIYKEVVQWIVETPARTVPIDIPEKTTSTTAQIIASHERIDEKQLPPDILLIQSVRYEGQPIPSWSHAPCAADVTDEMVLRLQTALRAAGYPPGATDGKLGRRTLHALLLYQRDHGLASGALTLETLQHFGLLDNHNTSQ